MNISTITQKGQVTLPAEIRKVLGVKTGDRIQFIYKNGRVSIKLIKQFDIEDLFGMLPQPGRTLSGEEIDKGIAKALKEKDERSKK